MSDSDRQKALGLLSDRGLVSSAELQRALGKSQASVSRLLSGMSGDCLRLGRARATQYGLPKSIRGLPAQQPIFWTDEAGTIRRIGQLSFLAGDWVHVRTDLVDSVTQGRLPWYLSPLQAQGFLGRLLARRLEALGVATDPEAWDIESVLFAATQLPDWPGALGIGESSSPAHTRVIPAGIGAQARALDEIADDVARTLPAGSSAGGEQPKFLARLAGTGGATDHVLVKFSPPISTPVGQRWSDLLHAEALAAEVLAAHGVSVAKTRVVRTALRTYLISERFDRIGASGRRHVVSIGAVHRAFVAGPYGHWALSCAQLVEQRRLPKGDDARALALLQFGRLIGNADMHAGNLGLRVDGDSLARGRFTLAPVYDMLPMRWRPDPGLGGAGDYSPFEPEPGSANSAARVPAMEFWARLEALQQVSRELRAVAGEMSRRLASW